MFDPVAYLDNPETDTQVTLSSCGLGWLGLSVIGAAAAHKAVFARCRLFSMLSWSRACTCSPGPAVSTATSLIFLQVWIFWNPATRRVCVAFRGTEQTKWKVNVYMCVCVLLGGS